MEKKEISKESLGLKAFNNIILKFKGEKNALKFNLFQKIN